jgi:hypothetical protein
LQIILVIFITASGEAVETSDLSLKSSIRGQTRVPVLDGEHLAKFNKLKQNTMKAIETLLAEPQTNKTMEWDRQALFASDPGDY